jgi:surface protein
MSSMFNSASAFNQPIGTWNVGAVTNMTNMFNGVTLSIANYHNLLIGWDALVLQPSVNFHGGNSKYCSAAAIAAHNNMTSIDLWVITDGGISANPTISVNSGSICAGQSFTMVPSGALTYTYSNGSAIATPTAYSTYSVSGTDAIGCVSSVSAVSYIAVYTLPTVLATTNNTLLCSGQTVSLTATGASSYTWNTTATTPVIAVSPTVTETYTVTGTDANGCINMTTVMQNVSLCTGVYSQLAIQNSPFVIYPNPNNGLFILELTTNANVTITNALGQIVISEMLETGKHPIDISNESSGVYFVKVIENNQQHIQKVIKQ